MTIVFADPTATLTAAGMDAVPAQRGSGRRSRPFSTAAARSAAPQTGAVRHGISAVLVRVARSIDPTVEPGVATAR